VIPCRRGCCKGRRNPGFRWLVCGTGHSGTGWAAEILTRLGHDTTHQAPLNYNGWMNGYIAPKSGVSTPYALPRHVRETPRSLLIVRHPARFAASAVHANLFTHRSDHHDWIYRHWPDMGALAFWNTHTAEMTEVATETVTLEEITTDPPFAAAVFTRLVHKRITVEAMTGAMAEVGVVNTHDQEMRDAIALWGQL